MCIRDRHESGYGESEMMEVFHKIPKLYAEVLILRYVNELGVSEIAELLNIKQNAVSKSCLLYTSRCV